MIVLTRCAGYAYIEILIATLLVVVVMLPALHSLFPATSVAGVHDARAEDFYLLSGRLEELLVEPFDDLDTAALAAGDETTPTTYSDVVTARGGRQVTLNVFLSRYDSDNADSDDDPFTGTEDDLLWVRVELPGTADGLETLLSRHD